MNKSQHHHFFRIPFMARSLVSTIPAEDIPLDILIPNPVGTIDDL